MFTFKLFNRKKTEQLPKEKDLNEKAIKFWMHHFLDRDKDILWQWMQITNIDVKIVKETLNQDGPFILVTVTLGKPGLLIGPYGTRLDDLCAFLTNKLELSVTIKIVEHDIWS